MRSTKIAVLAVAGAFFLLPAPLAAQQQEPRKHDGPWYEIVHIDYKPGKADDATDFIREHYAPALEEAGVPGPEMELVHETGDWDLTLIWHMDEGPSLLAWETSEDEMAMQKAFRKLAGGEEKAEKLIERYVSYIQDSESYLVRAPDRNE